MLCLNGFELYSRLVPLTVCDWRWGVIVDWQYYRSHHVFVSKYSDVSTKDYKIYDEPPVSGHPLLSGQYPEGGYIMEIQLYLDTAIFRESCRKKCTRQSRKVLWVVLRALFFKEIWKNGMEGHRHTFASAKAKESNKSRFDSYSVRNSVLIISHITFRDCRMHIFCDNLSQNSCIHGM